MPERSEKVAYCHACGSPMEVSRVAPFSNVGCPTCGKHTRVKREFGPYTLLRRHAIGGMSMVFVAQDNTLDREVAVKILSEEYSADERRITAFEEEARITASFSHPNVVRVLRTGKAFGRFYIAMELVPGGHFEHQINERGKIPEAEMLPLAIEVAQGLKAAHAAGLIHRDVKPGNILLDAEGHAKLVDFGLALVTHGGKAKATELWATPYYVPPETIEGFTEDFRSDIYAFGATLYHALSGKPSCGEETMATDVLRETKRKVVPLSEAAPFISSDTCAIIEQAMAYAPKDRFSSYDEMIVLLEAALKRLKSGSPSAAEVFQSASRRRAKKKQGERILFATVAVVLLMSIGGGAWWVTRTEPEKEVIQPVVVNPLALAPEDSESTEIVKKYREAHEAVTAKNYTKAIQLFVGLSENPAVQEPTRTWVGVEAVVSSYLDGNSKEARKLGRIAAAHVTSASGKPIHVSKRLLTLLKTLEKLPVIPSGSLDTSNSDPSQIMGWMLAGLKDWEQGMLGDAGNFFTAVADAKLAPDGKWMGIYQKLARDYLHDQKALSSPVFAKFPIDKSACQAAVNQLDTVLGSLKTRGRARFNVKAWQLDLTRRAALLETQGSVPVKTDPHKQAETDLETVMSRLREYGSQCQFPQAVDYLKTLPNRINGARRESLLVIAESSGAFLKDLEADLEKGSIDVELPLKSGEIVEKAEMAPAGKIATTDASGKTELHSWTDFSPDAMITLHRIFVKNSFSESERLRRHFCAISYDWLVGNRERALTAAATLSESSSSFKQKWDEIANGLPK